MSMISWSLLRWDSRSSTKLVDYRSAARESQMTRAFISLLRGYQAKAVHLLRDFISEIIRRVGSRHGRRCRFNGSLCHFCGRLPFCLGKFGRPLEGRRRLVKLIDNGMDENSLVMNRNRAVGRYSDPVVCKQCQNGLDA